MMLSNLLGVIVAFITVLLLLSLVVMALVQVTQATLRLRGRNLLVGVSWLLDNPRAAGSIVPIGRDDAIKTAARVLSNATPVKRRVAGGRDPNAPLNVLRGPKVTWIDAPDMAQAIAEERGITSPATIKEIGEEFKKLEPAMTDRFTTIAQQWTIVWAFVIAFLFQVSTPALIKSLAISDARREAILAAVPDVLKQAERVIPAAMANDFVDRALARLAQDFPGHDDEFAQASGSTDSKDQMMRELHAVLTGVPNRDEIVGRYGEIIDDLSFRDADSAIETANNAIDTLEIAGIGFWRDSQFYVVESGLNGQNLIGVFITGILLSFGAPFWFQQLKNAANLRNALARQKDETK